VTVPVPVPVTVTVPTITELALLAAWEAGYGRTTADRAVVLAALSSGLPADEVADLPLGQCDLLVLRLRELSFGSRMDALAECPGCGAELDVVVDTSELICRTTMACHPAARHPLEVGDRAVVVRPLTVGDLLAGSADRAGLLARCVTASPAAEAAQPVPLPAELLAEPAFLDAIEAELDLLDPQAAAGIDLDCPDCGASWQAAADVTEFVWSEVDRFARRLLLDVHALASAYGWTEADVLAVSPARRRFYLQECAP